MQAFDKRKAPKLYTKKNRIKILKFSTLILSNIFVTIFAIQGKILFLAVNVAGYYLTAFLLSNYYNILYHSFLRVQLAF